MIDFKHPVEPKVATIFGNIILQKAHHLDSYENYIS